MILNREKKIKENKLTKFTKLNNVYLLYKE